MKICICYIWPQRCVLLSCSPCRSSVCYAMFLYSLYEHGLSVLFCCILFHMDASIRFPLYSSHFCHIFRKCDMALRYGLRAMEHPQKVFNIFEFTPLATNARHVHSSLQYSHSYFLNFQSIVAFSHIHFARPVGVNTWNTRIYLENGIVLLVTEYPNIFWHISLMDDHRMDYVSAVVTARLILGQRSIAIQCDFQFIGATFVWHCMLRAHHRQLYMNRRLFSTILP